MSGESLSFLYILDEANLDIRGKAQEWWLYHSLHRLSESLIEKGHELILWKGDSLKLISEFVERADEVSVYANRTYHPRMDKVDGQLSQMNFQSHFYCDRLIVPHEHVTGSGTPYKVFTPYYKATSQEIGMKVASKLPAKFQDPARLGGGDHLDDWCLLPKRPNWAKAFSDHWQPGENGAKKRAIEFIQNKCADYKTGRDYPAEGMVSGLSPHLHFGEISAQMIVNALLFHVDLPSESYIRQLIWREFCLGLLLQFPDLEKRAFKEKYDRIKWLNDPDALLTWKKGETGIPIVDAGMRELRRSGYMHNRVRMIAASFLVKNLLIDWREGLKWFEENLVDADPANNAAGWQWVTGSGADAAPYFRVFNPVTQSERFDSGGRYIRKWVPELSSLPDKYLHAPWTAPKPTLDAAGIILGGDYPVPIVDLNETRKRALEEYKRALVE